MCMPKDSVLCVVEVEKDSPYIKDNGKLLEKMKALHIREK